MITEYLLLHSEIVQYLGNSFYLDSYLENLKYYGVRRTICTTN